MTPALAPAVRRQSIRVALSATLVVGVAYVLIALAVTVFATQDLTSQVDQRLAEALTRVPAGGLPDDVPERPGDDPRFPGRDPGRPYGAPFQLWLVTDDGQVFSGANTPTLPADLVRVTAPVSATIDGFAMRVAGADFANGRVIVAQSMEQVSDTQRTILLGTLLIAPFLLGSVFLGAVIVGRRVAAPVEAARRRQLEFTADASHELRTPLSVIEAHATLALAQDRDPGWYRNAFTRVDREARRMRRLLEDMLWLARFDATATAKEPEPVDLGTLVRQAVDRFGPVAETRRLDLAVAVPPEPVLVAAAPELLDRLVGVLVDNACKYAPEGGRVAVAVGIEGTGRVSLTVDDSGPGVPDAERERIFDRFHRSTATAAEAGGAGLGLAIGDAITRATGGRWAVTGSPLGGARFAVSWPRASLGG